VTRNAPDYALVVGVPGRLRGWVSRHGHPLRRAREGVYTCPESGLRYREAEPGVLRCLDLDEEAALPATLATGAKSYRSFHVI
jgi:UDP-2-acetamido-3-amino-2,3-dideoxy-glucuronate N-acetyltransferase